VNPLALLKHAEIKPSHRSLREYPQLSSQWTYGTHYEHMFATKDIPCVEVTIPERDWQQIQQIIQAHERFGQHPAVKDAWEKYLMVRALVQMPHSHMIK
jgi:hypothetical protein